MYPVLGEAWVCACGWPHYFSFFGIFLPCHHFLSDCPL
uniref:Uncharacterized protein n=1 Tax=Anguilla anguilla TaxID=7936 RepID=A0A0E9W692_ANGAN